MPESRRHRALAPLLAGHDLATLLFPSTAGELATSFVAAVERVAAWPATRGLPVALLASGNGAAAALRAAACRPDLVDVVVSWSGRPGRAGRTLAGVRTPTLLIAGEDDERVVGLNHHALTALAPWGRLVVVPRASHRFLEPAALAEVAAVASQFLFEHMRGRPERAWPPLDSLA